MGHDTTPMTIWHPDGEGSATVPAHQFETVWRPRGWHAEDPRVDMPSDRDIKAVWEVYAATHGIDTDGMTKSQIIQTINESVVRPGGGDHNKDAREGVEEDL